MNISIKQFVSVALLTYFCILYVDRAVSTIIRDSLFNSHWSQITSALPDLLLLLVVILSLVAYLGQLYRKKRLLLDVYTRLLGFIALALPVSYIVKMALKYACGRVETRFWLQNPHLYEFRWFHGDPGFSGFPSGHMVVLTTLLVATGRYLPVYKQFCYATLAVLAVLLVVTNYHFVGDIVSGAYVGILIEAGCDRFYRRGNTRERE